MRIQNYALSTALLAATALASFGTAHATPSYLTIDPNGNPGGVQATPETPLDGSPGFPCTGCTTNPVTTFGYTSPRESGGHVPRAQDYISSPSRAPATRTTQTPSR